MGKIGGFKEYSRTDESNLPVKERVSNYKEFTIPLDKNKIKEQGSRCMDCGIPFCHSACPLGNLIPDFNDILVAMMADTADVLKKTEKGESITNCFVSPEVQFIFDAVAEKTKARFSEFVLDDGSLSSKYVPWATLLDLSDPAFARNIAEEFAGLLKAHILALGKSQGLADKLSARVTPVSTDVLKTDAPSNKGLVSKYVASTFESLSEEQQARFEARVTTLIEAVESEPELLSDD